jgi:hypothetical protein
MEPAELNYSIGEKELLAIVHSIKVWRHYLVSLDNPLDIITDHQNLLQFQTAKILSRRQARWSERINSLKYTIRHRAGKLNGKADALCRRVDLMSKGKAADAPAQVLLRPWNPMPGGPEGLASVDVASPKATTPMHANAVTHEPSLFDLVRAVGPSDPAWTELAQRATTNDPTAPAYLHEGLLFVQGRLFIPDHALTRSRALQQVHDGPSAGHLGRDKTLLLAKREFYWPGMPKSVAVYVRACPVCQRTKTTRRPPQGLLQPLPVPRRPWLSIAMDHIVELPPSRGHNAILVIVDRHSKLAHFVPASTTDTARDLARQFIDWVYRHHGLPDDIVTDRGPTFRSKWWTAVEQMLKVKPNLSTAFHPQTDGQTERMNQILEQYL